MTKNMAAIVPMLHRQIPPDLISLVVFNGLRLDGIAFFTIG